MIRPGPTTLPVARPALLVAIIFGGTHVAQATDAGAAVTAGTTTAAPASGAAGARTDAGGDATTDGGSWTIVAAQRTNVVIVEPWVGRPIERDPAFLRAAPSYRRAIDLDREQRWAEATAHYQQALIEIGAAARFAPTPFLDQAAFKIEIERRRSRTLAQFQNAETAGAPARVPARHTPVPAPMPAVDRARLLRAKLMAVRSATGVIPAALATETLTALGQALRQSDAASLNVPDGGAWGSRDGGVAHPRGGDPELRLLLCATRAAAGDRAAARLEQAHVAEADRMDPARALAFAACQAALGYNDEALASLAVVVSRLGPSPRFLPVQTRELQSANDWDPIRADPRFERLFR